MLERQPGGVPWTESDTRGLLFGLQGPVSAWRVCIGLWRCRTRTLASAASHVPRVAGRTRRRLDLLLSVWFLNPPTTYATSA